MYQIIFHSCPSLSVAESIAQQLLEQQLAACVKILPPVTSMYRWQGQVERTEELLLIIKTKQSCFNEVATMIKSIHPYQVPEIVAVDIQQGLPVYLHWIDEEVL